LVRNLLLTREKKLTRKLKEIVLTFQIHSVLESKIRKSNPKITAKEMKRKVKEKVLEMYLNYIFLGNNSYGVEIASRNYF
jgi:penicillin-binding protein 1A